MLLLAVREASVQVSAVGHNWLAGNTKIVSKCSGMALASESGLETANTSRAGFDSRREIHRIT